MNIGSCFARRIWLTAHKIREAISMFRGAFMSVAKKVDA
jgi:hypothetical protein